MELGTGFHFGRKRNRQMGQPISSPEKCMLANENTGEEGLPSGRSAKPEVSGKACMKQ